MVTERTIFNMWERMNLENTIEDQNNGIPRVGGNSLHHMREDGTIVNVALKIPKTAKINPKKLSFYIEEEE